MGGGWGFKKVQYTKYRITKPWTTDTQFDDLLLSEPSRDTLAKFTKEAPLFLRFLKLITDVENRPQAFIEFARRCENGLVVEKDVFITKDELMKCIWENGFSQNEMNAFEFAFPADYKFHYPELAVLFDLPEEDCYKYCIRQRAKTPEKLVEIKYEKPKNLLSSYGLCFLGVWYGFSNQVLSNAWFYSKTFPFGAVFYMLASYFYRNIREYLWKEEKAMIEGAKDRKDAGEELVHRQLKKYANDARCLEYVSSFKDEVQHQLAEYHAALLEQMRQRMVERIKSKLMAIQQAEKAIQGSLQEVIVRELVDSFHRKLATDTKMQDIALKAAIEGISGDAPSVDPVGAHFVAALKELGKADFAKSKPTDGGSVLGRVSAVFQSREEEFLQSFTVSPEEANEVKQLVGKCKSGDAYDFSKLSEKEAARLDALQLNINDRVGYSTILEADIKPLTALGPSGEALVEHINKQLAMAKEKIRNARLTSFARLSSNKIPLRYLVGFSEGLTHLAALAIYYMLKDDLAVAEALVVETTAGRSMDQSAENVSDFITAKAVGSLIVAYLSGYLLERTSKQSIFLATSIFPLFIAFITFFMTDAGGAPSYDIKTQLRMLMEFLKQSVIWGPALYIFAYMAGPDYDDALFFYFTNKLGFSPTFMGTLRFTYGIAALVGVVMYRTFFKSTGFRKTLLATILVAVPIYLSPSLEGSVYAMMMSVRNTGAMASRGISAILTYMAGITSSNFTHLTGYIVLCGASL
ncbi:BT1 folate/biopterin transporter family protein, related [Eimeria brunetti]|uniref:BT1 folate/biopterin transporter family protein, related n=1 Tax=Eimeria brunetti TaxID=51314 RepID=U6LR84_9EIME|nr:BT1 folate/biopterin transporter family protein, related [Eimeria brunetti]